MNVDKRHPLEEVLYKEAPKLLKNKVGEHIFGVKRAVELLSQFPKEVSFREIVEIFEREQGLTVNTSGNYFGIPENGPLIVAANHPYPMLGAISIGKIIESRRPTNDMKIFTNSPKGLMPEWDHLNIPVGENMDEMIIAHRRVSEHLGNDGTLIMFPAGVTSYRSLIDGITKETSWKSGITKFSKRSNVPILPVHISAQTSDLYNFLKNFLPTEYTRQLNLRESIRKDVPVHIQIGDIIESSKGLTPDNLRKEVYRIGGEIFRV